MDMRLKMWLAWLALTTGLALLLGCEYGHGSRNYPPDPLLLSKTPVEARPSTAAPAQLAARGPEAPEDLTAALAQRPPRPPLQAVPASRQKP